MRIRFHPDLEMRLREVGRAAEDIGVRAYAVGGVVRDALHGHENRDVDVCVVGDALRLCRRFAEEWSGAVRTYPEFGTATLTDPDGFQMDFATARSETYRRPGALPAIQPSTLQEDLRRRDFTVNAIAASLADDRFGEVIDPNNGRADLEAGRLRVLHVRSFADDPTRLFRAARYAVRLGLEPDEATEEAAVAAVRRGALRTISGDRRRNEVALLCGEALWAEAVAWLNRWQVWESIGEGFVPRAAILKRVDTARRWMGANTAEPLPEERDARWLALLLAAPPAVRHALRARAAESAILRKAEDIVERLREPASGPWSRAMDAMPATALMLALTRITSDSDKARLTHYIADVRPVRLGITGHDLRRAGVTRGPDIRRALERTLDALREGTVVTHDEQLAYAVATASEEGRI